VRGSLVRCLLAVVDGRCRCGRARGMEERVVVVGAGPAGLAAAWAIRRAGVDPLIVEKAGAVAASWRGRHDQLRLKHAPDVLPSAWRAYPPPVRAVSRS
jgi:glycine/D-amino acid oxidase-like deaminating enzyme